MQNSNYVPIVILSKAKDLLKKSLPIKLFLLGFLICFLADGIGLIPKPVVFSLFLLNSLFLGIWLFIKKEKIHFVGNTWIFIGAFIYLLYLFFLSFFSLNVQVSFEFTVFISSLFLVCIVVGNYWEKIEQPFLYGLLGLGIFFCLYSSLLGVLLQQNIHVLYPLNGYQYIYAMFGSNHLGEFLVFPLLVSFYFYIRQKKRAFLYLFLLYFLFFFLSYSRAAYIGFFVGFLLLSMNFRNHFSKKQIYLTLGIFLATLFFFFLISSQKIWQDKLPLLSQIVQLNPKSVVETRESYMLQGLKGFLEYRFYGVGIHNFEYTSRMFTEIPEGWASSSHNIFMDVLTETGIVSFVIFSFFAIFLLRMIKRHHRSLYAVLLLSWFGMAQFDYIHQMYSYLLLFPFLLTGVLCYKTPCHPELDSGSQTQKSVMLNLLRLEVASPLGGFQHLLMLFLLIFLAIYITSAILLFQGNYQLSRSIYPLQKGAYESELSKKDVLDTYTQLFPGEYRGWLLLAKQYEKEGNMSKAIESYEKSFWLDPFRDLSMAQRIYNLKHMYNTNGSPKWFADKLFKKLHNDTDQKVLSYEQWLFMNKFCQKIYNFHCIYILE